MTRSAPRLTVVSHSREVGGAEVYVENLTRYLAQESEKGWKVEVILRRQAEVDPLAEAVSEWADVLRLDFNSPQDVVEIGRRMSRASVVHLNLSFPTGKYPFGAAILARALGKPLVVTHHLALRVGPPWRQLMRWLGATAHHIAVSHHAAAVLMLDYGYSRERIDVIHNGVDARLFRPGAHDARAQLKRSAGEAIEGTPWPETVLIASTVARLSTQKGLFDLIDSATRIDSFLDLKIVLIGDGELRRSLADDIRARGMGKRVFILGSVARTRVAEWLAASDLFVLPSRYEGGPATALMEAMASGCAVVATNVSGVNELVTDDSLGRLVPAHDPAALASATVELLSNPELRAAMGRRAREKVLADFTIEACVRKTEAVLEAAIGR